MRHWHPKTSRNYTNGRRFFRIDMDMKTFVVPSNGMNYKEIYATGATYYTPNIIAHGNLLKRQINENLFKLTENKELVSSLVSEFIVRIDFLHECLDKICDGLNPARDPVYTLKVSSYNSSTIEKIEQIKASSPKSYQIFKEIEEFLGYFVTGIISTVSKSSADRFFPIDSQRQFKAEGFVKAFDTEGSRKIPFLQVIKSLVELAMTHANVYRQISFDCSERENAHNWNSQIVNISEGGIALLLNKRFEVRETVDVLMYAGLVDEIITMKGYVVNVSPIKGNPLKERVSINFDFPDGKMQAALRKVIQKHEVKGLMKVLRESA